jgi:hypothetical protein
MFCRHSIYIYVCITYIKKLNIKIKEGDKMKQITTIRGKPVIEIYESFNNSYWFITERCYKQDSLINGKVYKNDQILFGYVRLAVCPQFAEWGYISETELKLLGNWVWKVQRKDWPFCPEVEVKYASDKPGNKTRLISIISKKPAERGFSKQKMTKIRQGLIRKISQRQADTIKRKRGN